MKQVLNFCKQHFIPVTILFLTCLIVWHGGPRLHLGGFSPLETPEQRFILIAILLFVLFLKFIFIDISPKRASTSLIPLSTQNKITRLQGRFQGALKFLKKTIIQRQDKNVNLLCLPWYLLIGPTGAGKTTLLANSTVNFILSKQFKHENRKMIHASEMCDWWVTRDLVLVDIPGNFLQSKLKKSTSAQSVFPLLWQHLLKLTEKFSRKHSLHGVILALNLPEIIKLHRQQKNQIISDLKKRIHDLLNTFSKDLPIHLVITKCDLLPGFIEFFNESSTEEVSQAWGIAIPPLNDKENLIDVFTQRFNVLIKRLNKQLIARLHQERNPHSRIYIKDFPLHIERLKEGIVQFLKALALPQLRLQSIYLTSGLQEHLEDHSAQHLATHSSNALQMIIPPPPPSRPYFIRQIILHHLLATYLPPELKKSNKWQRRIVYSTSIATIVTAAILLGRDFQHSVEQAYSIRNYLAEYQTELQKLSPQEENLAKALPLLTALQQAAERTNDSKLVSFYKNKSQETAKNIYQNALQTLVLPNIQNQFEKYLKTASENSPENIYPILKGYLMLGDSAHFQENYILKILQQLSPTPIHDQDELAIHIKSAFEAHRNIKLNEELISQVRDQLTNLNSEDLAFAVLKSIENYNTSINLAISLDEKQSILTSVAVAPQIPTMFTASVFQKILDYDIQNVAQEVLKGNWILGNNPNTISPEMITELTANLRSQYVAKYIDIWESLLDNIQLQSPQNLSQVNNMLLILTSNNSPLLQFLDSFKRNAAFTPVLTASPKLQMLSSLLNESQNNGPNSLYGIFVSLKQLNIYLQTILSAQDTNKALFEATAKRMQDKTNDPIDQIRMMAEQNSEPMKSWLTFIAEQTWKHMLQETAQYIDHSWQNNIISIYKSSIAGRYPFNQSADKEVDLNDFVNFLGQQGQLASFYQTFLKPFVEESDKQLKWRILDAQKLPFSDQALDNLAQSNRLQRAFFPNGDNKLYVPFSLQPVTLDKNMKGITLNVNGQEVRYEKNLPQTPRLLTWPGTNSMHATTVNFVGQDNQLLSNKITGNWGWFKLVTNATETVKSRKEILLNFSVDGHNAKYLLFTQGHLNPFLPLNLSRFELPEHLIV